MRLTITSKAAVLTSALGIASAGLAAQQVAPGPLDPVCVEGTSPVIDTSTVTVGITAAREFRGRRYSSEQQQRIMWYADAIRARFVAPASLGAVPVLGNVAASDTAKTVIPMLTGELVLITKRDGQLKQLAWQQRPLAPVLATALARAAQEAAAAGDFAGLLRADGERGDDTLVVALITSRGGSDVVLPLMRAQVPSYVIDTPTAVVKSALPGYPLAARRQRVSGDVVAAFIVGSDAKVVDSSVQLTRADWFEFMVPVRRALQESVFRAGMSGGCRVPTFGKQPFRFQISDP